MDESILNSIKKLIGGFDVDCTDFDVDLIIHINTALAILTQLGVGPTGGFSIKDQTTTWGEFIPENKNLEPIKTFVYLKTKLIFDTPMSSAVIEAIEKLIDETQYRILCEADPGRDNK